jgi:hypothetical protein
LHITAGAFGADGERKVSAIDNLMVSKWWIDRARAARRHQSKIYSESTRPRISARIFREFSTI